KRLGLGASKQGLEALYSEASLKALGRSTRDLVERNAPFDFALSVHADPLAYADLKLPCGFLGDCNFALLAETYPRFSRQSEEALQAGEAMWRRGLEASKFVALASAWAVEDSQRRYPEFADRLRVLPFGTNVTSGWDRDRMEEQLGRRSLKPLRLLSVGVDWERKGMADAVEVYQQLVRAGVEVRLDLVGCRAPEGFEVPSGVRIHGRLSRGNPEENQKLTELFERADAFILASRAECFGIVFGEAGSYALPSVAIAAAGIPTAVREGVSGCLFPSEGWPSAAATEILKWTHDFDRYQSLARGAWQDATQRLSWNRYAATLLEWSRCG
ncbi:MAG: glycosyltransferase family 4 protein, partial [Verrucomicrobiales bacterium]